MLCVFRTVLMKNLSFFGLCTVLLRFRYIFICSKQTPVVWPVSLLCFYFLYLSDFTLSELFILIDYRKSKWHIVYTIINGGLEGNKEEMLVLGDFFSVRLMAGHSDLILGITMLSYSTADVWHLMKKYWVPSTG